MTSFIHVEKPATHPGIVRAEAVIDRVRAARRGLDGARGLAVLLLSAIVSSLLVVADWLMSNIDEGGLLVAWVVLWGVAFVGLALFAGTARSLAVRAATFARDVAKRRAAARADEKFLAYAQFDPRIMKEVNVIATHQQASADLPTPSLHEALRRVNLGQYY